MARASRKQPAKQRARQKKAARQRPTDWANVKVAWPQAKQAISLRTAQLAKRQRTWFRHQLSAAVIDATTGALEPAVIDAVLEAVHR